GTYAMQSSIKTSWTLTGFEAGTNVPSTTWALRTVTYDAQGNVSISTKQCGGTTIDLCTTGGSEAYTQFIPAPIYDNNKIAPSTVSFTLPKPLQGSTYTEPQSATLIGISLNDPLGAWPASSDNVGAGANQTNGATWVDVEGDGSDGITSYAVPPG